MLCDGRRVAAPGAAFANGVLGNSLDIDDGHRVTKGHPGAIIIPVAMAAAESRGATCEEFLLAALIGYEVAIRAGIELHAREADYHASGAWGSLGAAVACARLFGLDSARLGHAVNIAEYHAPIADMSRAVTDPAMTKDAVGWGAFMGMSSALLAEARIHRAARQGARCPRCRLAGRSLAAARGVCQAVPMLPLVTAGTRRRGRDSWPARWARDRVGRDPHVRGGQLALHPTARNDRGDAIQRRVAGGGRTFHRAVRRGRGDAVRR